MGQKAKNAGKKQSKICDKLANAKSVKYVGKTYRVKRTPMEIQHSPNTLYTQKQTNVYRGHTSFIEFIQKNLF